VTEAEWMVCTDTKTLLEFLLPDCLSGKISTRKQRLYLCAGCREIGHLFYEPASLASVEVAERFVDGEATEEELGRAEWDAEAPTFGDKLAPGPGGWSFGSQARIGIIPRLIEIGALPNTVVAGEEWQLNDAIRRRLIDAAEIAWSCSCIRPFDESGFLIRHVCNVDWPSRELIDCVFGNPFRFVNIDPPLLTWNDGVIPRIAQGIYAERAFDRMPILHDAGCNDEALLTHCRNPEGHVRGCWALDLILGKE
jgi:hypothetical protein